jgi:hypothetical protein
MDAKAQRHLDDLQTYLATREPGQWRALQAVRCADGFTMSVQASSAAYCEPRSDNGPWDAVEIGFPNRIEPLLWPYAESREWTETVYGYVPIGLAAAVIELHGGAVDPYLTA